VSDVTAVVCTKDRHGILPQALLSIALQTVKPERLIILDDSEKQFGSAETLVQQYPAYGEVFQLLQEFKISWQVVFGERRGQHCLHQAAQEIATTEFIFRLDDDEIAEPDVLATLLRSVGSGVGAVGGLVLSPSPLPVPPEAANIITDLDRPNIQWFKQSPQLLEVDHLHSTFLYRRGVADYELSLSPAAHREETLFSYSIKRKGFKVLVDTSCTTWHFRAPTGGIRSHHDPGFWNHDENVFCQKLLDWGVVTPRPEKIIVLDCGRGDHLIVKKLLPRIKDRYPVVLFATSFPDIFNGEKQISIGEARKNLGNLENHSIYKWCIDHDWKGNLVQAHEKFYGLE